MTFSEVVAGTAVRVASTARGRIPDEAYVAIRPHVERLIGRQEPELSLLLREHRARRRRFVDVGANWGTYAILLAAQFARVDAFEPIDRLAHALARYAARRDDRITVHHCALSDADAVLPLFIPPDTESDQSGRARIVAPGDCYSAMVPARTLDSFGFDDVDLMKIDVEGHERSVIMGAAATLRRCRPTLLVEIEARHNAEPVAERFALLESLGYEGSFLRSGGRVSLAEFSLAVDQDPVNIGTGRRYVNNFFFEPARSG